MKTKKIYDQGGTKLKFSSGPGGPPAILFGGPLGIFSGPPFLIKSSKLYSVIPLRQFQWDLENRMHY